MSAMADAYVAHQLREESRCGDERLRRPRAAVDLEKIERFSKLIADRGGAWEN